MSAPVNQLPSAWAFRFTVTDSAGATQQLFWDYVQDDFFTWNTGVFLCWFHDGIWLRIAGIDHYPSSTTPEHLNKLVTDCVAAFNEQIETRWPAGGGGGGGGEAHPVDPEAYEHLLGHLFWNAGTQRFEQR